MDMVNKTRLGDGEADYSGLGGTRKLVVIALAVVPILGVLSLMIALVDIEQFDGSESSKMKLDEARIRVLSFVISHMAYCFMLILG